MKKLWESRPNIKTVVITIVVSLSFAALVRGRVDLKALWGLTFAALYLVPITLRNYNPDRFEAHRDPIAYAYRMERDRLHHELRRLVEAVEAECDLPLTSAVVIRADAARRLLNEVAGPIQTPAR